MTPHETARIAVHACLEDLKLRGGFRELIASIPDWADCEKACVMKVERALESAAPAAKPQQETLEFAV